MSSLAMLVSSASFLALREGAGSGTILAMGNIREQQLSKYLL